MDRNEVVQGGNRRVKVQTEIVIDNYKKKPVNLRLYERAPFTEESSSLRISMDEISKKLTKNVDEDVIADAKKHEEEKRKK